MDLPCGWGGGFNMGQGQWYIQDGKLGVKQKKSKIETKLWESEERLETQGGLFKTPRGVKGGRRESIKKTWKKM